MKTRLPADIDSFLQDIAQVFGTITYDDIYKFKPTKKQILKLRLLHGSIICSIDDFGMDPREWPKNDAADLTTLFKMVKGK